eukprot:6202577-Pleurochrysis_carterae.AAC.4
MRHTGSPFRRADGAIFSVSSAFDRLAPLSSTSAADRLLQLKQAKPRWLVLRMEVSTQPRSPQPMGRPLYKSDPEAGVAVAVAGEGALPGACCGCGVDGEGEGVGAAQDGGRDVGILSDASC